MNKSWRTSMSGVLFGLTMLFGQLQTLLDDDPKTNPEYTVVLSAFGLMAVGFNARDNKVTSEQVGLKTRY